MPIEVSIVVPTYNQKELLAGCLHALVNQEFPAGSYEVIIIDDGSTDGTGELVRRMQSKVSLNYFRQENKGPGSARNLGISKANGSIIGFTDTDCVPGRNWIKSALPYFSNEQVAGVEGKTIIKNPGENTPFSHQAENIKGGNFMTCNIFYRKNTLGETGGFDERYKLAIREDSDLAFTVLERGGRIVFAPEAVVAHPAINTGYSKHLKKAGEGFYDALLYKKHPELYRKMLKWYDGRAFPVYYYGYYFSIPVFAVSLTKHSVILLLMAVILFSLSHIATIAFACRKKTVTIKYLVILFFQFLIIPFIRFYWVMRGNIKFKTFVW